MLLEFEPPPEVDWSAVVGEPQVRLVVPLRVVEELDAKKYVRRSDLADRARRLLPQLEQWLGDAEDLGEVRPGVTLEVPVEPGNRRRPSDADTEILEACEELHRLTGSLVTLITADTAMILRARARAITVKRMPVNYQRSREAVGKG